MQVDVNEVKRILKETYLEIANNYSVSDLCSDGDKVSCVASAFRQKALDKLEGIGEDDTSTYKIFAEALIQIIENQMKLKEHLGIVSDTAHHGDCYWDHEITNELKDVK